MFRRIHVVREGETVSVLGSECFRRTFKALPVAAASPKYSSSEGRHLTDEERQLLIENTRHLIQRFEAEYQAELVRLAALEASRKQVASATVHAHREAPRLPPQPSPGEERMAEVQAKDNVRKRYGVDPELPGWRGLVLAEMRALLRRNAG
ncbi:MAG: hypothetical protein ABL962_14220 [Fimbriimonadaceae bacterium]